MTRLSQAALIPALSPVSLFLNSCAPSGKIVRVPSTDGKLVVSGSSVQEINEPHGYARLYADDARSPIYFFIGNDGRAVAILSICSHRGCSVKKVRQGFECPCHGSEYDLNGNVVKGPAPDPLEEFAVERAGNDYIIHLGPGI